MAKLHHEAKFGNHKAVEALLNGGENIEKKDADGRTALHWAADKGHIEVIKVLLARNADVNARSKVTHFLVHL
jgi:ankyrin repeat protein